MTKPGMGAIGAYSVVTPQTEQVEASPKNPTQQLGKKSHQAPRALHSSLEAS